ncbi:hypothetical protein CFELI_11945 [Corynebacterium felinum]|uniref:Uncharacterized protein n=1 Tax=Corynebacterium felinum TaxID=131318 RepID=A0ABU2B591_9CORY|nr:hypothetical protein [Corynebacterium felinum]WJY95970.1 hypothetical protein CFELI_11945 [Corynebacterium felinum]
MWNDTVKLWAQSFQECIHALMNTCPPPQLISVVMILAQIFHGVGLVVVGWGGVFVGLVGSPSPFDSWFLGQGVRP